MALTPTQLGTKSRTISAPNPNIRTRPNGLGRSPKMGRVQQLAPYQLGELVETPIGLRRIKGVSPVTINVDLGPQSTLRNAVEAGATSFTVNSFKLQVQLAVGDVIIVGNSVDSYRETVKVSSATTTSSTGTTTISISTGFTNSHAKNDKVVIQKLPPNFPGEFVEIDELKILGDDSYAYIIPSVPKSPRYISRTGDVGNDDVKNEETATQIDPTDNFQKYESIRVEDVKPLLDVSSFPAAVISDNLPYQLYLVGFNFDGTKRPVKNRFSEIVASEEATFIDGKEPMILTCEILEKGSSEHQHAETEEFGTYTGNFRVVRLEIPANYESGIAETPRNIQFANEVLETLTRDEGSDSELTSLFPRDDGAVATNFFFSHEAPDDLETDQQRETNGHPTGKGYANALLSNVPPGSVEFQYIRARKHNDPTTTYEVVYLYHDNTLDDNAVAQQMHQTVQLTGTLSVSSGSTSVTGVGTQFTTELATSGRKSILRFEGDTTNYTISSITDDTNLTLTSNALVTHSAKKGFKTSFTDVPIIKGTFLVSDPDAVISERIEIRGTSTAGKDNAGFISGRVFLELPQGQPRWSSKRALDNGKGDETGFVDAFQSPEDQPNETFGFYVGKNEESLPFMKMSNNTGETVLDGRVKLTGYIFDAPRVEAQELKKIRQRSGFYKARLFPHIGFFPKLEDRPDGPPEGWEPRAKTIQRTLTQTLKDLSMEVKKQMRD